MECLRSASASLVLLYTDSPGQDWSQTLAEIKGFGGSNFGIPIRYANPLLNRWSAHSFTN